MLSLSSRYLYLSTILANLLIKCRAWSSNISSALLRSFCEWTGWLKQWQRMRRLHASPLSRNAVQMSGFTAPFWSVFSCCSKLQKYKHKLTHTQVVLSTNFKWNTFQKRQNFSVNFVCSAVFLLWLILLTVDTSCCIF